MAIPLRLFVRQVRANRAKIWPWMRGCVGFCLCVSCYSCVRQASRGGTRERARGWCDIGGVYLWGQRDAYYVNSPNNLLKKSLPLLTPLVLYGII